MYCRQKSLLGKTLVALCLGAWACQEPAKNSARQSVGEEVTEVTAEHYKMPPLPRARLSLEGSFSHKEEVFWVEVASTPEATTRGLMWRKSLGPREGMLFDFAREGEQSFWMKNTLMGLDLVFISEEQKVVGVIEQATPRSLRPLSIGRPSRYVLEIPAGTCAKIGVRLGSRVHWQ